METKIQCLYNNVFGIDYDLLYDCDKCELRIKCKEANETITKEIQVDLESYEPRLNNIFCPFADCKNRIQFGFSYKTKYTDCSLCEPILKTLCGKAAILVDKLVEEYEDLNCPSIGYSIFGFHYDNNDTCAKCKYNTPCNYWNKALKYFYQKLIDTLLEDYFDKLEMSINPIRLIK